MNGDKLLIWRKSERLLLCAAAGSLLCGCVSASAVEPYGRTTADANLPAASQINAQAAAPGVFPTFADIPQIPADLRTNEGWRMAIAGTEQDRTQLLADTAPGTFSLTATTAFAETMRGLLHLDPADIPTADQAAASEAWARQMRARATPPPRPR